MLLAIEPVNRYETGFINTAALAVELVDLVGSPGIGLVANTFHMNIEEPSIEQSIRQAGPHIFHFHVADSNRWYPGAGHLDFARLLATLAESGYRGWVSGEFMAMPDPDTAAALAIEHLRAAGA